MLRLGTITYNIAKDWDLPTILKRLEALKYEGVELRTTHAHGVEVDLSPAQRAEVKKRFDDSPVELAGMGSAFEYQATDPAVVRKNIEGTKEYVRLAHDLGAPGVKVRPNGVPKGADLDATLRQIGRRSTAPSRKRSPTSPRSWPTPIIRTSSSAGTRTRPTSATARSARISRWWPQRFARSTSATSTTRRTPGGTSSLS